MQGLVTSYPLYIKSHEQSEAAASSGWCGWKENRACSSHDRRYGLYRDDLSLCNPGVFLALCCARTTLWLSLISLLMVYQRWSPSWNNKRVQSRGVQPPERSLALFLLGGGVSLGLRSRQLFKWGRLQDLTSLIKTAFLYHPEKSSENFWKCFLFFGA